MGYEAAINYFSEKMINIYTDGSSRVIQDQEDMELYAL